MAKPHKMPPSLLSGFIETRVPHHASQHPTCGLWLIEELARHGYTLSPGRLYPTPHSLEQAGCLTSERRLVTGCQRRYHTTMPADQAALAEPRARLGESVAEVSEGKT